MTLADRDRRALRTLAFVAVPVLLGIAYQLWPVDGAELPVASADAVSMAEQTLRRVRNIEASAPGKSVVRDKVAAELAEREKGLIQADSAQQAQAQTLTILRDLLGSEGLEIRGTELGPVQALGDHYGLAPVSVQFECHVEQMVNILASINSSSQLIALRGVQIAAGDERKKTIRVRLTAAGVIPKSLLPEKDKGKATKGGIGI